MAQFDSDYLKEHVGDVLSDALAEVAIQQPADPIEFVGLYLLNADATKKRRMKVYFFFICFSVLYLLFYPI